jgi:hypothetical protein
MNTMTKYYTITYVNCELARESIFTQIFEIEESQNIREILTKKYLQYKKYGMSLINREYFDIPGVRMNWVLF